jgi:hypothetical protein
MKLPKFPDDFYGYHDGVDISDEKINEWIQEGVADLEVGDGHYWSMKSGNTIVEIHKLYDEYAEDGYFYDIKVCKGYWHGNTL